MYDKGEDEDEKYAKLLFVRTFFFLKYDLRPVWFLRKEVVSLK